MVCEYCERGSGHNIGCPNYEEELTCDLCGKRIESYEDHYETKDGLIMCYLCNRDCGEDKDE